VTSISFDQFRSLEKIATSIHGQIATQWISFLFLPSSGLKWLDFKWLFFMSWPPSNWDTLW
jgi:hypothetical protein